MGQVDLLVQPEKKYVVNRPCGQRGGKRGDTLWECATDRVPLRMCHYKRLF